MTSPRLPRPVTHRRRAGLWLAALVLLLGLDVVAIAPVQALEGPGATAFHPLAPQRILDTRIGTGAPRGRPRPGSTVVVQVTGVAGVPSTGVTAVMLQLTVTDTWTVGYVQALPTGRGVPGASSNLNVTGPDQTASNLVTVPVGTGGAISLLDVAGGHLLADVVGYFSPSGATAGGRYEALTPTRVLDTRVRLGMPPVPPAPPGAVHDPAPKLHADMAVQVAGAGGIPPSGASAAVLTVTATQSESVGYLQVVPTGGSTGHGSTSNVNLTGPGQTMANLVVVPLGPHGTVDVYSAGGTHVVIDVVGYFTDASAPVSGDGLFVPVDPARLDDTRSGSPMAAGSQRLLQGLGRAAIPTGGVSALLLNATATETAGPGYLQVFPTGLAAPGSSSSVNYTATRQTVATAAVGNLGDAGAVSVHTSTRTHVVVDVFGYFTGRPGVVPPADHPLLRGLAISSQGAGRPFESWDFPHWVDADGDCQDTRTEVLLAASRTAPVLDATGCAVVSGTWTDPFSGRTHTSPADLVVDHAVAPADAYYSGAWRWDRATRTAYANFLAEGHLLVIGTDTQRTASWRNPEVWRPARLDQWCSHATGWATVKRTWALTVTPAEHDGLTAMLATC